MSGDIDSDTNQSMNPNNRINNDKKEMCDTRVSHTPINNNLILDKALSSFNNILYDKTRGEFLNFRVRRAVKMKYLSLDPDQRKMIRDVLEQIILDLPEQRVENKNIVLNINLNQQVVNVEKNENVLRLKKEIDRLNRELEKLLSENLELKKQISELQSRLSEQSSKRQHGDLLKRVQVLEKKLSDYRFYVAVVIECLESEDCDKQKLLYYLKSKVGANHEKKDLVLGLLKQFKRGS